MEKANECSTSPRRSPRPSSAWRRGRPRRRRRRGRGLPPDRHHHDVRPALRGREALPDGQAQLARCAPPRYPPHPGGAGRAHAGREPRPGHRGRRAPAVRRRLPHARQPDQVGHGGCRPCGRISSRPATSSCRAMRRWRPARPWACRWWASATPTPPRWPPCTWATGPSSRPSTSGPRPTSASTMWWPQPSYRSPPGRGRRHRRHRPGPRRSTSTSSTPPAPTGPSC